MTEFKVGQTVKPTTNYKHDDAGFWIGATISDIDPENMLPFSNHVQAKSKNGTYGLFRFDELQLIEPEKENEVTEYQKGDRVRMVTSRNGYGESQDSRGNYYGYAPGTEQVLTEEYKALTTKDYTAWSVEAGGWVRSDDIELVSRKEEPLSVELTSEMIDWEEILFGKHYTENAAASFKITRFEGGVNIKIPKGDYWEYDDLAEFGIHILTLAEYLETGTVDLSEEGLTPMEGLYKISDLLASNERLASANEAKRQRLARIRELAEE